MSGLIFLTGLFFLNFTSRVIFSPLLPLIEEEMKLDHAQSGSFFLCISVGYFLSILSSGYVSSRISHKRCIVLSSLALGGALFLLGSCSTLFTLQLGLFVLGLGAGLYFPSGLATICSLVPSAYLARGMAIHELAPNLGFVAAPLISDLFLHYGQWRYGLAFLGTVIIVTGILYGLSSHGSSEKGSAPDMSIAITFFRMPVFWGLVALFSLAICSTLGVYAMAPLFLVNDHGMDPGEANTLLVLSRIASIIMPLFGGWLADKIGNELVITLVLCLSGILTACMGVAGDGFWLIVLVVAQPIIAVCFFPAGFAVLTKLGSAKYGNISVSLCLPLAFLIGGGLMPALIGFVGDLYSISMGILAVGILMFLGGVVSLFVTLIIGKKMIV